MLISSIYHWFSIKKRHWSPSQRRPKSFRSLEISRPRRPRRRCPRRPGRSHRSPRVWCCAAPTALARSTSAPCGQPPENWWKTTGENRCLYQLIYTVCFDRFLVVKRSAHLLTLKWVPSMRWKMKQLRRGEKRIGHRIQRWSWYLPSPLAASSSPKPLCLPSSK